MDKWLRKKEIYKISMCHNMDEPLKCDNKSKKPITKGCNLWDCTYMRCTDWANLERQKVDWWLPGGEWDEKLVVTAKRCGVCYFGIIQIFYNWLR